MSASANLFVQLAVHRWCQTFDAFRNLKLNCLYIRCWKEGKLKRYSSNVLSKSLKIVALYKSQILNRPKILNNWPLFKSISFEEKDKLCNYLTMAQFLQDLALTLALKFFWAPLNFVLYFKSWRSMAKQIYILTYVLCVNVECHWRQKTEICK